MADTAKLTSLELFTGAGGLALGVSRAGFRHHAVVELNPRACDSLRENTKRLVAMRDWPVHEMDAAEFPFSRYKCRVDLLAAGAPCQPFSLGGKHQGHEDERNLFPVVFKAVRTLRPKVVIIENVRGLLRPSFADYFEYIEDRLRWPTVRQRRHEDWRDHKRRLPAASSRPRTGQLAYEVDHVLVNAADYGVAQRRERVFIIAIRSDLGVSWSDLRPLLAPTHSEDALLHAKWVDGSYWKEHRLSDPRRYPEAWERRGWEVPTPSPRQLARIERLRNAPSLFVTDRDRWRTVRDALRGKNPLPEPLEGQEHPDTHNHLLNPGARAYHGHDGSTWDEPAKTLKAGDHGVPGGENMLQLEDGAVRYFTVREAARLQGFPDGYVFRGAWTQMFRQLGNSVPVDLAETIARQVAKLLRRAQRDGEQAEVEATSSSRSRNASVRQLVAHP